MRAGTPTFIHLFNRYRYVSDTVLSLMDKMIHRKIASYLMQIAIKRTHTQLKLPNSIVSVIIGGSGDFFGRK